MQGLIDDTQRSIYADAMYSVFATFMRPFEMFVNVQQVTISTSPTYSRFGDHSQNSALTVDNTAVSPISYIVSGCILYGNKQPWDYSNAPGDQQNKLRQSAGIVRIKVDQSGYALLKDTKQVNLDGFDFTLNSNARPHGLVGNPSYYSFTLQKVD